MQLPDLAWHFSRVRDPINVSLFTFDPDADDDGRAKDFGVSILEDGYVAGDGSLDTLNYTTVCQLFAAMERAPDMVALLTAFVNGTYSDERLKEKAHRLLQTIESGELVYQPQWW